jgi:hypothetical protein
MLSKKWFSLVLGALLASTIAHGQFVKSVGLKAGVAISSFRVTDLTSLDYTALSYYSEAYVEKLVSPSVSLFATFLDEEHVALQADLTYLRKGAGRTYEFPTSGPTGPYGPPLVLGADTWGHTYTEEASLQYLEFALALQPKVFLGGNARLYAHIGPTATYLLTATNFAALETLTRVRFGYTLGLGAEPGRLFGSPLFIEARYAGDFSPVFESKDGKVWNSSWILSLGTTL